MRPAIKQFSYVEAEAAYLQVLPIVVELQPGAADGGAADASEIALLSSLSLSRADGSMRMTFTYPIEGPARMYSSPRELMRAMIGESHRCLHLDAWAILRVVAICPGRFGNLNIDVHDRPCLDRVFPEEVRAGKAFNSGLIACGASYLPHRIMAANKDLARKWIAMAYNSGVTLRASGKHVTEYVVNLARPTNKARSDAEEHVAAGTNQEDEDFEYAIVRIPKKQRFSTTKRTHTPAEANLSGTAAQA